MIGNDVIDLEVASRESDWKREGYLQKLFTPLEIAFISDAQNSDTMVWLLWSLKESTYKAMQRIDFQRGFYPIKIEIQKITQNKNTYHSEIQLFDTCFYGQSTMTKSYIHSMVTKDKDALSKVKLQSKRFYSKDCNGLPTCENENEIISVSHHGNYRELITLTLNP